MHLLDLVNRPIPPGNDEGEGKIPWNDPAFSRRMLAQHLSQDHDWASRRKSVVEGQISRIAASLAPESAVLDLGCGPGFYTARLAALGHQCTGVDFSPASIEYAIAQAEEKGLDIRYECCDVRAFVPRQRYDAVLALFGEINVFTKTDAEKIIGMAASCLRPGGSMFIETHTFDEVKRQGLAAPTWEVSACGLFSESPHLLLTESFWNGEEATTRFAVIEATSAECTTYTSRMAAYTDDEYTALFTCRGFDRLVRLNEEEWPVGDVFEGKLCAWECKTAE